MGDQEFVKYIVSALVSKPDKVEVERVVDERGVLLTLHVDDEDLGRVIGRKGSTAQSLRTLLRVLGNQNEAHYNLRIADSRNGEAAEDHRPRSKRPPAAKTADDVQGDQPEPPAVDDDDVDFADDGPEPKTAADEFGDASGDAEAGKEDDDGDDSLLDKTKRELDDLNDLDI